MKYKVVLQPSEEGFAVSVPALPGCHSQGATEQEALRNVVDAIHDYLDVMNERYRGAQVREVEVIDVPKRGIMQIDAIREVLHKQPFRPFTIRLADGLELPVRHPDFVAITGRTVIVANGTDERYSTVEPLLIVSIDYADGMLGTADGANPGGSPG